MITRHSFSVIGLGSVIGVIGLGSSKRMACVCHDILSFSPQFFFPQRPAQYGIEWISTASRHTDRAVRKCLKQHANFDNGEQNSFGALSNRSHTSTDHYCHARNTQSLILAITSKIGPPMSSQRQRFGAFRCKIMLFHQDRILSGFHLTRWYWPVYGTTCRRTF